MVDFKLGDSRSCNASGEEKLAYARSRRQQHLHPATQASSREEMSRGNANLS